MERGLPQVFAYLENSVAEKDAEVRQLRQSLEELQGAMDRGRCDYIRAVYSRLHCHPI